MSPTKSAAARVGRIGALAVALGVGAAVATGTGVAWADTPESGTTTQGSSDTTSSPSSAESTGAAESATTSPESNSTAQEARSADTSTPTVGKRQARRGVLFGSGRALTTSKITSKAADALKRAAKADAADENTTRHPTTKPESPSSTR
jgi:hypothetical protein